MLWRKLDQDLATAHADAAGRFETNKVSGSANMSLTDKGVVDFFLVVGHSWGPVAGRQMQFEWQQPKKTSNMSLPSKGSFLPKKNMGASFFQVTF